MCPAGHGVPLLALSDREPLRSCTQHLVAPLKSGGPPCRGHEEAFSRTEGSFLADSDGVTPLPIWPWSGGSDES